MDFLPRGSLGVSPSGLGRAVATRLLLGAKMPCRSQILRAVGSGIGCVAVAIVVSGCGLHRAKPADATAAPVALTPSPDSLERFIAQVRKLSMEARPDKPPAATIEGSDPRLLAALAAVALSPSIEGLQDVAHEYARIGVNDRAYEYLTRSLARDRRNAAGYDALARLWRDSGFPERGLADAHRAVYYAPASPIAHNTLGTILQLVGAQDAARREFERARQLDPTAVYALSNLCYAWLLDGHGAEAEVACDKALQVNPHFAPARNNLALTYAMAGRDGAARRAFEYAGDAAQAQYNMGLLHLARHEYREALDSFKQVVELRPDLRLAAARVRQAEQAIVGAEEEEE